MRKKFLSSCMIAFLGISLASCSSDSTIAEMNQSSAAHYSPEGTSYISLSPEQKATSRSALQDAENYLNFQWKAGDTLIVVEPTAGVIGTLTAAAGSSMSTQGGSVSASFSGTVKGTLTDGDKLRFYYLGNKNVALDAKSLTIDYSQQGGTLDAVDSLRYQASDLIEMKKDASTGKFGPSESFSLSPKASVIKFNITYQDNLASECTINGVYNSLKIDLCNGTFTAGYASKDNADVKSISMKHTEAQASPYYYVAVPVSADNTVFSTPNMNCTFFDDAKTKKTAYWKSFTISVGKWYAGTNGNGITPSFSQGSDKDGYSGSTIGDDDPMVTKEGYSSGGSVNDQVDDPKADKPGYGGADVTASN